MISLKAESTMKSWPFSTVRPTVQSSFPRSSNSLRRFILETEQVEPSFIGLSRRIIRLCARILYTQTDYLTSYRSFPKLVPDGWPVSSINPAFVCRHYFLFSFPYNEVLVVGTRYFYFVLILCDLLFMFCNFCSISCQLGRKTITRRLTEVYILRHFRMSEQLQLI